jgi:hypothetical protein
VPLFPDYFGLVLAEASLSLCQPDLPVEDRLC